MMDGDPRQQGSAGGGTVVRVAVRALAIAIYSLAGAAMIVDARTDGGTVLPEVFPLLAELRETRQRLQTLGRELGAAPPEAAGQSPRPDDVPGPAFVPHSVLGREVPPPRSGPPVGLAEGDGTRLRPTLPAGSSGVRVNRGLP